ncbi:ketohexokinase-like [Drosophila sulfurigaster albostrigata]|uniref:ketohexokinase-like n=1 Tax=Drosophila sulfurigaster albostrigata TaxID=89887 RepID=UPI002D21BF64|nr:ketohexokinase-like [Drosophila sulfurigaster albostrigata]
MNHYCALSMTKPVLCVGNLSMDIITICKEQPEKGKENCSLETYWQRGGHASIVSFVLSLLNAQSEFLGMLSRSPILSAIITEMQGKGIEMMHCPKTDEDPAFSTIMVSKKPRSSSVIHCNRGFPYCRYKDFKQLDLSRFGWVHFEARNVIETVQMVRAVLDYNNGKKGTHTHIVTGKFGIPREYDLASFARGVPRGAGCLTGEGVYHEMPPYKPQHIVDTHGAGACFTAGFIYATYIRSMSLSDAVEFANRVAGHKITDFGYNHIAKLNIYPIDVTKADVDVPSAQYSEDSEAEAVICRKYLNRKINYSDGKYATQLLENPFLNQYAKPDADELSEKNIYPAYKSSISTMKSSLISKSVQIKLKRNVSTPN